MSRRPPTWVFELAVAVVVLFGVAAFSGGGLVAYVSAVAVALSFAHTQVADRLAEAEERRVVAVVDCYPKLARYLIAKEAAWVVAFVASGMWPALVGCGLFLAYPLWRRAYRRWRPA